MKNNLAALALAWVLMPNGHLQLEGTPIYITEDHHFGKPFALHVPDMPVERGAVLLFLKYQGEDAAKDREEFETKKQVTH